MINDHMMSYSEFAENLDKIIKIIRSSKTPDDAKSSILKTNNLLVWQKRK